MAGPALTVRWYNAFWRLSQLPHASPSVLSPGLYKAMADCIADHHGGNTIFGDSPETTSKVLQLSRQLSVRQLVDLNIPCCSKEDDLPLLRTCPPQYKWVAGKTLDIQEAARYCYLNCGSCALLRAILDDASASSYTHISCCCCPQSSCLAVHERQLAVGWLGECCSSS